jgi:SAM-dependent methyltransferase
VIADLTAVPSRACLRTADGAALPLPADRWFSPATAEEHDVLQRISGPVIDVGCGPGRHVEALVRRGVEVLGIDVSRRALAHARKRGAPVLERSIFEPVPGAGRWGTALLFDGNVGIGGCPTTLLRRVRTLLRPVGRVLVEVDPPGGCTPAETVRFEIDGECGPWFKIARLGADRLCETAAAAGFECVETWQAGARWFGRIDCVPEAA